MFGRQEFATRFTGMRRREKEVERIAGVRDVTSRSTGAELRFATSGPETIRATRRAGVPLASGPKTDRNSAPFGL